jgi:hypothetical protein
MGKAIRYVEKRDDGSRDRRPAALVCQWLPPAFAAATSGWAWSVSSPDSPVRMR